MLTDFGLEVRKLRLEKRMRLKEMLSLVEANPAAAPWLVGALLGAAVGTAIAKNGEGAWIGAGVGLLLASFLVTVKDQKSYAPAL